MIDIPLFFVYNVKEPIKKFMKNERIHMIIRNIELLLNQLKKELDEDSDDKWLDGIINSLDYEWGVDGKNNH